VAWNSLFVCLNSLLWFVDHLQSTREDGWTRDEPCRIHDTAYAWLLSPTVPAAQPPRSSLPAWTTARESDGLSPYIHPIGQRLELVSRLWPRPPTWPVIALKTCINTSSTLARPWCSRDSSSILCPNPAREKDATVHRFSLTHTCVARVDDPHHSVRTVNRQCGQSSRDA
jgi:hypothetical protein